MLLRSLPRMSNPTAVAARRSHAISRHMASSSSVSPPKAATNEPKVLFKSQGTVRQYILNRPEKINALDDTMLNILRPYVEEWSTSQLGTTLVGTGIGRGFCAGGDIATVAGSCLNESGRNFGIEFFRREFELDYMLAAVQKPYVVIMDGITMGGGVGLSAPAPFRVVTEKTLLAMPETKIGYAPDVGASYYLSRLDGEIGTYMALTGDMVTGRLAFEHGFATHFIPSRRIPALIDNIASLENPTMEQINDLIEESYQEREPNEPVSPFVGKIRTVLDSAFRHNTVREIFDDLKAISSGHENEVVRQWASRTLGQLELRSPTSLVVSLEAIRRGKNMSLLDVLQMEMNFAAGFSSAASLDFKIGVTAVLVDKTKGRPLWNPATVYEVDDAKVIETFFKQYSPENGTAPVLDIPESLKGLGTRLRHPAHFALPPEEEIERMVVGSHEQSGATTVTLQEVINKFNNLRRGKRGVREKILEVVNRKCVEVDDPKAGVKWLKWVH